MSLLASMKVPYIVMKIMQEMNISHVEAFDIFYGSKTYKLLSDKATYYWSESAQFVAESFMREQKGLLIEEFENI
jgi:hypothetical protein